MCTSNVCKPQHEQALLLRSRVFIALRLWDNAIEELDAAIELWPKNAALHIQRARVYFLLKDQRRAVLDIERAIRLDPASVADDSLLFQLQERDARVPGTEAGIPTSCCSRNTDDSPKTRC